MDQQQPLRIAILLNSYRSPFLPAIRASYERAITAVSPDAQLSFFFPAYSDDNDANNDPKRPQHHHHHQQYQHYQQLGGEGTLPSDPSAYDLIVLGGSNVDPRARHHAWIQKVHRFVRDCVSQSQSPPGPSGAAGTAGAGSGGKTPKMCGICWGHQTIALLFGGEVVEAERPEVRKTNTQTSRPKRKRRERERDGEKAKWGNDEERNEDPQHTVNHPS